jgi:hypothetical protein
MANEVFLGVAGADGTPITAIKTVGINPNTGAVAVPPTQDAGSNRVVLYNTAGAPLIVAAASDGRAASQLGLLTDSRSMALNPAGALDQLRVNANRDLMVQVRHSLAWVSATGASGAAVTLTIPAGGAGIFNYLCYLQIIRFAAALLTAAATPVLVTTTGMTGTPTFSFAADALAQGALSEQKYEGTLPIIGSDECHLACERHLLPGVTWQA